MKLKLYTLLIVGISMAATSCKTASKMYQKGNYDEAVELAAKKLQKDPNDPKLLAIIQDAYRYAVNDHENQVSQDAASNSELKWEWMYNDYASLQKMYDAIYKVPSVFEVIHPMDYTSYLDTYAEKAGQVRLDRGISFQERGGRENAKLAYREFQSADHFLPGDREISARMNEAYEEALLNVVILPFEQNSYQFSSFNYGNSAFDDNIIRQLQYQGNNEFVKFYSAWEAKSKDIRADEVIDMRFSNINIGRYRDNRNKREVSKEIVTKETVYRADSIVKEYGRVTAQITTTTRTMHSEGLLEVNIRDGAGRWLWTDHFTGNHEWRTEFATYTGDVRALSESDKQLVSRNADQAPQEEDILRCIMEEINTNMLYNLREHYRNY
ncbi:MAG TPA: hypothetical protein VLJ68_11465 [Chitinophagaceae bacterium]|nr:hypothetical protein [Chitinophagaceae bacterium]